MTKSNLTPLDTIGSLPNVSLKSTKKLNLSHKVTRMVLPIDDYLSIESVPFQRDTETRAKKAKVKESLSKLIPEHLDVQLVRLTQDCVYADKDYYANTLYIVNGNTRKYYWMNGLSDYIPEEVFATVYEVDTLERMQISYNTFDSANAVERNQEKIFGIICNVHGFNPTSSKIQKGEIISALNLACFYRDRKSYNQPNVDADKLVGQTALYLEEIKAFDKLLKTPKNWDQALSCAALMSLKKYGTSNARLLTGLELLNRRARDTMDSNTWDGITHISEEWTTASTFKHKGTHWEKDSGLKQTTSWALYWIKKFMENTKQAKVGKGWEETGEHWFDEEKALDHIVDNHSGYKNGKAVSISTEYHSDSDTQLSKTFNLSSNKDKHIAKAKKVSPDLFYEEK